MALEVQVVTSSQVGTDLGWSQACQPTVVVVVGGGWSGQRGDTGLETQSDSVVSKRGIRLVPTHHLSC